MKIIRDWFKRRKERKEEKMRIINEYLMKAGYLCPNYELHEYKLLDWEGNIRYITCKKCGKQEIAMAKIIPS